MAKIVLGLGSSHTPMLNGEPADWAHYVERDSTRTHIDPQGRRRTYEELLAKAPAGMREQITPQRLAQRHAEVMAAMEHLRKTIRKAALDALIVVGDDHKEVFDDANLPSMLIYHGPQIRNRRPANRPAGGAPWFERATAGYYEADDGRDYPVHAPLARHIIDALVDQEFDIASADRQADGKGEGHAFAFVHKRLMNGAVVPVVPVFLNTYYPPNQPTPGRCYRLGQAIRAAVDAFPGGARIGIIASGGLSHTCIDEDLDQQVIRALQAKDAATLAALPRHKLDDGNSEIRNWICAAGAVEHLSLDWVTYVPGYRTPAGTGTGMCFATWT
jgi:3-O-methylgallate 3,4-dioxygenase